jgi:hypothetical protein
MIKIQRILHSYRTLSNENLILKFHKCLNVLQTLKKLKKLQMERKKE